MTTSLLITAYSVTSAFATDGDCVTVSGTPVTLPTPFGVVTATEPSATDPQRLQSIIESDFFTWLHRAPTCSLAGICIDNSCLFAPKPNEPGTLPGAGNTVIAIVILVTIALVGLVWYVGQNHFRRTTAVKGGRRRNRTPYEPTPYLQPKTELDAVETSKNELEGRDGRNELEQQGGRYEIEGGAEGKSILPSLIIMGTHELGGEEHSRELDGREIILS